MSCQTLPVCRLVELIDMSCWQCLFACIFEKVMMMSSYVRYLVVFHVPMINVMATYMIHIHCKLIGRTDRSFYFIHWMATCFYGVLQTCWYEKIQFSILCKLFIRLLFLNYWVELLSKWYIMNFSWQWWSVTWLIDSVCIFVLLSSADLCNNKISNWFTCTRGLNLIWISKLMVLIH